jgi:hypothetical protein
MMFLKINEVSIKVYSDQKFTQMKNKYAQYFIHPVVIVIIGCEDNIGDDMRMG